jgi:hypothetical protein
MRVTRAILIAAAIVLAFSCHKAGQQVKEIKDKEFTLQVSPLKDNDAEALNYKARLTFDKQAAAGMTREVINKYYYKMDSCFYIKNGNGKQYADLVQPVANGVSGSYEYLVEFASDPAVTGDSINMVYQDRYTSHKQYQLTISKK